ncbi:MAG TPA: tRNA guanosine(34) transglycosylase Tgt [Polyangiaceae bacterium]|nr:tRNA guanosine(34) transglycosylase Tgt [Polyangiaceae bacterium]
MDTPPLELNRFAVEARSGHARAGTFQSGHGPVRTPAFMPVGTQAAVKAVTSEEVIASGAGMLISNTYHLWLRPGAELIAELGGLHRFMRWPHAIATDSGGFQAFSLASRTKLSEAGFEFSSHLDGSRRMLTPEESMRVQGLLGSDIALQLDVCLPGGSSHSELVQALERTTRWAERCLEARTPGQALFGIVQGGTDVGLRLGHAEALERLPVDGIALGGFSVGEPNADMHRTLAEVVPEIDQARPRYLMGVGTPSDLVRAIGVGVDIFDCVIPSRNARNGQVFTRAGKLAIRNARFQRDPAPLEEGCACPACKGGVSRAYLRHLYISNEIVAHRWLTLHNLHHYGALVHDARQAIVEGRYEAWAGERLLAMASGQ